MSYLYIFNFLQALLCLFHISNKYCISSLRIFHIFGYLNQVLEVLLSSLQVLVKLVKSLLNLFYLIHHEILLGACQGRHSRLCAVRHIFN
jgi:hypothetical protein